MVIDLYFKLFTYGCGFGFFSYTFCSVIGFVLVSVYNWIRKA